MKPFLPFLSALFLCCLSLPSTAQAPNFRAVDDTVCIMPGQADTFNVLTNDILPQGGNFAVELVGMSPCFRLLPNGILTLVSNSESCCGTFTLSYRLLNCDDPVRCFAKITVTVKCPKPDCSVINFADFAGGSGAGNPDLHSCANACANSATTVFVSHVPGVAYTWSVTGGTFIPGANPAEIIVSWGPAGTGNITLTVNDGNGPRTFTVCVNILPQPVAAFTKSDSMICKGGAITFTNTSIGGNHYFWDFGDGQTSSMFSPTHDFNSPGTYTVCLYVTKDNVGPAGNPLCCCTDTMCMDIVVDSLEGPNIYCVSTLCAGDSTKYWTDALNCGSYQWTVLDHNGLPVTFTGQGNDTICVQWGAGPFGTVSLQVMNCAQAYCDKPVTVTIPIIPATAIINGPTVVCQGETATYTLPKWTSVYYDWQPIGGGTVVSGQGTNVVVIQWGSGPTGTITVNYYSQFLGTLPGHSPPDCGGTATLNVQIKPQFSVQTFPGVVCVNATSTVFGVPFANYVWSVSPALPFSGQGTNAITINWTAPGTYIVTAMPVNPTAFCNNKASTVVQVLSVAAPDSITGPLEICPGDTYTYLGHTSQSGTTLNWTITGGTPATGTGSSITVIWNPTGPYMLSLSQTLSSTPMCASPPIQLTVLPKLLAGPLTISGPPGCTNSVQSYVGGPAQHPDATFNWTISPATAGSVVSGQGTPNIDVQWNNTPGTPTLILTVALCGNSLTHSIPITLNPPIVPVITQTGTLCPGSTAVLNAGSGFIAYAWSTPANTQTTTISAPGTYIVTTTDINNCQAIVAYQAVAAPGPVASITTGDPTVLCISPPGPAAATIVAQTGAGYTFQWFCNGTPQVLPPTAATFIHTNTNAAGSFSYQVVVTGPNGCTSTSNVITIVQQICTGGPGPACVPDAAYTLSFISANQNPNCNIVDFTVSTSPNVTLTGWNFGDPNSNTNTGTLAMAQHSYTQAGCYLASVAGQVPGTVTMGGVVTATVCNVGFSQSVCIPVAANFSYSVSCLKASFTDLSTFLPGESIMSWSWNFGDTNTGTGPSPMHTYAAPGTYPVTLTVMLTSGCKATTTQSVTVAGLAPPGISYLPNPPCEGDPVDFTGSATGSIISWFWNFGDGSNNGSQNPSHTYLTAGTYPVMLTVTNSEGCMATSALNIIVNPAPPQDVITFSPSLTVCAGQSVTLTAPAGTGYTYLWSDNSTGPTLTVTASGTYSVVVSNAFGCTMTTPAVTVTVLPAPPALISGVPVICDAGCTALSAPAGFSYQWLDPVNPIPFETGATLQACAGNLKPAYAVSVTDGNGCTAVSPPVTVTLATSPSFSITVAPDPCEGSPSTLTVVPVQTNVIYSWSNGGSGPSITVSQAGTYTATGVDTTTGCRSSAFAIIYPLPDLCLVPVGCYESCNPDTICGPAGLASYQWNLNGLPIAGATGQCYIATQSGSYSLTGTTSFGCIDTSGVLMLELMDCGCDNLTVSAEPVPGDTCCWSVSYNNSYSGMLSGLAIHTTDADFVFDLAGLHPSLQMVGVNPNGIVLTGAPFGSPLPQGALNNFLSFCFKNVQSSPQQVIFDWYDDEFDIVCSDTLEFDCPVEPDCLYLLEDSIYCENKVVKYTFTVCNPIDAPFSIGYLLMQPTSPTGVVLTPPGINASPAIAPGECRTYTVTLSGPNIFGQTFCYKLLAHDFDPAVVDTALCCSLDTLFCIDIPDCEPCDDIEVSARPIGPTGSGPCCFNVTLSNNYSANYFDGINLCLLTPGASFSSFNNTLGSGWATISYTPTMIALDVIPPLGSTLPLGITNLPVLCIQTRQFANPLLEIKWMQGDSVVCRDTVVLACFPPCGYFSEERVVCRPNGTWSYQGTFHNSSPYTLNTIHAVFTSPPGMSAYNQSFTGLSLPPGGTLNFSIPVGAPAMAGDSVCFTFALHDTLNVECCNIRHCIKLPDCPTLCINPAQINPNQPCIAVFDPVCGCNGVTYSNACVAQYHHGVTSWTMGPCPGAGSCSCDDAFNTAALAGFSTTLQPAPPAAPFTYTFAPKGMLMGCDRVTWRYRRFPLTITSPWITVGATNSTASQTYTFPGGGLYQFCMLVERTTPTGEVCTREVCVFLNVFAQLLPERESWISIAPNPSGGLFFISTAKDISGAVQFRVLDILGRRQMQWQAEGMKEHQAIPLDLSQFPRGMYILEWSAEGKTQASRILKE